MPRYYAYEKIIVNEYLGKQKVIKADTEQEFNLKIWEQKRIWAELEAKKQEIENNKLERQAIVDHKTQQKVIADDLTVEAQTNISRLQNLLTSVLDSNPEIIWEDLFDISKYKDFKFNTPQPPLPKSQKLEPFNFIEAPPTFELARDIIGVPKENAFFEFFLPKIRKKRIELGAKALVHYQHLQEKYEERKANALVEYKKKEKKLHEHNNHLLKEHKVAIENWEKAKEVAYQKYQIEKEKYLDEQKIHNENIKELKIDYETGDPVAINWYVETVLAHSEYPEGLSDEVTIDYAPVSNTIVISYQLPHPDDECIPKIKEYRYIASRDEITQTELKQKERELLYESIVQQITLRCFWEVFNSDYSNHIKAIVFNGWVHGIDPKTGNEFDSCIISCQASCEQFIDINLKNVNPKECLRGLKALDAGPLAQIAPVRPILDLQRNDSRFVESREVLDGLKSSDNLAVMDWEAFEHLVRELFERMFSTDGAEVKITQASRDRGVDAIAFDPDPIRGGKYVIQAKRYNAVVPAAAVRELYGTMQNEGAVKGILVTTSDYGHDSREFAKDKPLTLINGSNLIYLFQQHGYNVTIELQKGNSKSEY